ncbi:MAG: hypothetical protein JW891_10915 [Candidatus Lokiarchaeota archaeon]|nr:hypothetical protein [Candidatus Lokiarchaeota archaeon]
MYELISFEDLNKRIEQVDNAYFKKVFSEQASILKAKECYIHQGDLEVDGVFASEKQILIVDGNLIVNGLFLDRVRGHWDSSVLIVLGDVNCTNLCNSYHSDIYILGKLKVSELLYLSAPDSITQIFNSVEAKYINGMWITAYDSVKADIIESYIQDGITKKKKVIKPNLQGVKLSRVLIDDVLNFEEWDQMDQEEQEAMINDAKSKYDYCLIDDKKLKEVLSQSRTVIKK